MIFCFECNSVECSSSENYKMNDIINKFLLAGNKFIPEIHLKQPGITYSFCGSFTKNKERIQKFKKTGNSRYIYRNELDKACFQHDMAYGDFKDLTKRTPADKFFVFYKKTARSGIKSMPQNEQLTEELHKPIIRKFKKREVYSAFKDNIWGADLADMQLISKFNKEFRFLLCVIDIFGKYAWVVPLKDKKGVSIVNAFQNILDDSKRKPNKIWVDKGSEFYNNNEIMAKRQ